MKMLVESIIDILMYRKKCKTDWKPYLSEVLKKVWKVTKVTSDSTSNNQQHLKLQVIEKDAFTASNSWRESLITRNKRTNLANLSIVVHLVKEQYEQSMQATYVMNVLKNSTYKHEQTPSKDTWKKIL